MPAVLLVVTGPALEAQGAPSASGRASTTIGAAAPVMFLTDVRPGAVTQIPRSRQNCAPGVCFSTFVQVKANADWVLQVRLAAPTPGYTLSVSSSVRPNTALATPTLTNWVGAGHSGGPSGGRTVEVTFYGARLPGPGGRLPGVSDVQAGVRYQAIRR